MVVGCSGGCWLGTCLGAMEDCVWVQWRMVFVYMFGCSGGLCLGACLGVVGGWCLCAVGDGVWVQCSVCLSAVRDGVWV